MHRLDPGWFRLFSAASLDPGTQHLLHPLTSFPLGRYENLPQTLDFRKFRAKELHRQYGLRDPLFGPTISMKTAVVWSGRHEFVLLAVDYTGSMWKFESCGRYWTAIEPGCRFDDVIAHKGELLGLDVKGRVVNVMAGSVDHSHIPRFGNFKHRMHMFHSKDNELMLAVRDLRDESFRKYVEDPSAPYRMFRIYKLNEEDKTWAEVKSLGDSVVFCGSDSTFVVSSADAYGRTTTKNCVFFRNKLSDYVFDLETSQIMLLENCPQGFKLHWPPPAWLLSS